MGRYHVPMTQTLKIDFVSDVACPWCAVGLNSLEQAVERVKDEIRVELHFQPFELNPRMGPEGEDSAEHLKRKYGMGDAQLAAADRRLAGCGLPALSPGVTNPLPWLAEMMDVRKEQNFFEGKVTDYQKGSALVQTSDDDL